MGATWYDRQVAPPVEEYDVEQPIMWYTWGSGGWAEGTFLMGISQYCMIRTVSGATAERHRHYVRPMPVLPAQVTEDLIAFASGIAVRVQKRVARLRYIATNSGRITWQIIPKAILPGRDTFAEWRNRILVDRSHDHWRRYRLGEVLMLLRDYEYPVLFDFLAERGALVP